MTLNRNYLSLAVLFSLLSSLRLPLLPEIQFFVFLFILAVSWRNTYNVLVFLVLILTTHHYVVPDVVYRFQSGDYPSIYTSEVLGFRTFNLLVIVVFLYALRFIKQLKFLYGSRNLPFFILPLSFVGIIFLSIDRFASEQFFFIFRSYILLVATLLMLSTQSAKKIAFLCCIAMVGWSSKMFFSIVFPHENPLLREIFGMVGKIYFAGDEYLTLGIYLVMLCLFYKIEVIDLRLLRSMILLSFFAFLMAIFSLRSGSLPYFVILFLVVFLSRLKLGRSLHVPFNLIIVSYPFFLLLFLILNENYVWLHTGSFYEYSALASSAVQSIFSMDIMEIIFGISPFGKYEIVGLSHVFDHQFSFGSEVGNQYRYHLWSIPGGRLVLNAGVMGFLFYYGFIFFRAISRKVDSYYLILTVSPVFFVTSLTPVNALAFAFGICFLMKMK